VFARFESDARAVVEAAQHEAHGLGHNYIGTEHLLLGLLSNPAGAPARLLGQRKINVAIVRRCVAEAVGIGDGSRADTDALLATLGIDIGEVRRRAERTFGPFAVRRAAATAAPRSRWRRRPHRCDSPLTGGRWLAMTPRTKRVLELAAKQAERLNDTRITPTHLLLGLLVEGDGLACEILAGRGVCLQDLKDAAHSALDDEQQPNQ
jgi:ATP-dependent Clp protease ATP-binding subunit ClpA